MKMVNYVLRGITVFCFIGVILCTAATLPCWAVDYPFSDKMDSEDNWTGESAWALTDSTSHSDSKSWTDSPIGAYQNLANISLTLESPVDLSTGSSPTLVFWHKYELESEFDYGHFEISKDGGATWILMSSYTGISDWTREQIDLSSYSSETNIKIRFRLETDKTIVGDGWYIDDVSISELPNAVMSFEVKGSSAMPSSSLDLTWTKNQDIDFASYRIFRSTTQGVTTQNTLVTTLTDQNQITYTDTDLSPETVYYYKVYVFNTNDLAAGSREESAATGVARYSYPFFDDFEGNVSGWTANAPWGIVTLEPDESYSGTESKVWTDSPDGAYAAGVDTSLQTTIDLGSAQMPVLSFWQKYALESNSDHGYIEIREVGTQTWNRIYFITGTAAAWFKEKIDLSGYAGKEIDIRFRMISDTNGIQSQGWFIDDFRIDESETATLSYPFSDDMEGGAVTESNWHSSSWGLVADSHSGNYAFTDSPAGNYGYTVKSTLIMASTIDLKEAEHPQLSFWHKYTINAYENYYCSGSWGEEADYGRVYLSTDRGQPGTWTRIGEFSGTQVWTRQVIDLSNWGGLPDVRIKFVMEDYTHPRCNRRRAGWTIDDIVIKDAPLAVDLILTESSQERVSLSWTENTADDFFKYELYRSNSSNVSRNSHLVDTITNASVTTYMDRVAMVQPDSYYYRIYVIDQAGNISQGSNVVHATYSVPSVGFPFTEDAENGSSQWSWGTPWGITAESTHEGDNSWTDSPGANYPPNADTTLTTFINLGGTLHPVLTFWHRYFLEEGKDYIKLEVSTDEGNSWIVLRTFTGIESEWNKERINLTNYAGQAKLGLRFHLTSGGANQQDGWYMDDMSISEEAVQAAYPFFDDMESGEIPWFYHSPWALTTLSSDDSYSGVESTAWTDSPWGSYRAGADTNLYISIDLGSANMPVLTFWHRYSFEQNSDWGYVEIRESGASSWERLYMVTGTSSTWLEERIDLSEYAGKQAIIRFRLTSNGTLQSDGWYIDDITIDETLSSPLPYPFKDDMESDTTNEYWHTSSWELLSGDSHSGSLAYTDSPMGNYGYTVKSVLIMANTLDLSNARNPQLSFWHKYTIKAYENYYCNDSWGEETDYGRVYLSTNKGQTGTWTRIASFNGTKDSWKRALVNLNSWSGLPDVRIKFVMEDNTHPKCNQRLAGWTIDDIAVEDAPTDVTLLILESSQNSVELSWSINEDQDFERYELYRSYSPGVTRSSQFVASIPAQKTTNYTDAVSMVQPWVYYYKMWVIDKDENISLGGNEVQASYTVPTNTFPFTEDAEGGTTKWSMGTPWGITEESFHTDSSSWTDSPGANYSANADTTITTYLNLSGTSNPVVTFWHHYSLESGKDYVKVEVSADNGQTWTTLRSITGTETGWNQERLNLTDYAGNAKLGFRIHLISDGANQQDGWYMDDLIVADERVQAYYPFSDDMEAGIAPWFYGSPWGLTTSNSHSEDTCWTDSPNASYRSGEDTSLYIRIDLGSAVMPVLTFWHRYAFEANHDWGYVEVREVGTPGYKKLYMVTGTSSDWLEERIDLSEYAGKQIDIRFRLTADTNGIQSDGWYIDDISIAETPFAALPYPFIDDMDTENTLRNWHSSSWERGKDPGLGSDAHSGSYAYVDSPLGNYGYTVNSTLIMSSSINLKGAVHPQLTFWHKYSIKAYENYYCNASWGEEADYGRVYLSTYNGQSGTWTRIRSFNGNQNEWKQETIDLSTWAGLPNVRIKFVMEDYKHPKCNKRQAGWAIDDVRVGEDTSRPFYIAITSGRGQVGETAKPLAHPFIATVYNENSVPSPGIPVLFEVTFGNGTLSVTETSSDTSGNVSSILTLWSESGANTVTATIVGSEESVTFSAIGYKAGQAYRIEKISGDNQVAEVGQPLANSFMVKVYDIKDSNVEGANVFFSVVTGDGSLSTEEVQTDTEGLANSRLTIGSDPGEIMISASSPGLQGSPVSFVAHAVLPGGYLGDTDGDGLPNEWEIKYSLNPEDSQDASQDSDSDGLTNLQEFINNINPRLSDTDKDGMPDAWEITYGLDPNNPADALSDNDGDGATNLEEYNAGTAPLRAQHFHIVGVTGSWMDFYGTAIIDGLPLENGDEVGVLDPDGVICGHTIVTTPGQYGFMHIYKDDPITPVIDEGAQVGDELTFLIWDASAGTEVNVAVSVLTGPSPPSWTSDGDTWHVNLTGAGVQKIPLQKDWNLISFSVKKCFYIETAVAGYEEGPPNEPMLPGTVFQKVNSIGDILLSIEGKYDQVRSFDSRGAHTFDPSLPGFSDLKYMAGGYGYWIKMKEAGDLELNGIRATAIDSLELSSGWNLIGYWHPEVRYTDIEPQVDFPSDVVIFTQVDSINDILSSISGEYIVIRSYDKNGAHTYDPLLEGFNDLDYLGPGYGMWIKMKQDAGTYNLFY